MGRARKKRIDALENRLRNAHISLPHNHIAQSSLVQKNAPTPTTNHPPEHGGQPNSISRLTSDVLFNILSRLPIKTLKSCVCVCKFWYHIIRSDPPALSSKHATHLTGLLLHAGGDDPYGFRLLEFEQSPDDRVWPTDLSTQSSPLKKGYKVVGSCDGLVCLVASEGKGMSMNDQFCVCNPVLGEYTILPPPTEITFTRIGYGFGVDSATKEYKVIRLTFCLLNFGKPSFQLVGEVFTIGGDTWRSIGDVPYPLYNEVSKAFVNGLLHWMTDSVFAVDFMGLIVSFDVASEKFNVVPHPPGYCHAKPENGQFGLCVLGGKLCFSDDNLLGDSLVIWVMNEYGVEESWVKQYVVKPPDSVHLIPLMVRDNQEILLSGNGKNLFRYDPVAKTLSLFLDLDLPARFSAITCTGSLISLRSAAGTTRIQLPRKISFLELVQNSRPHYEIFQKFLETPVPQDITPEALSKTLTQAQAMMDDSQPDR